MHQCRDISITIIETAIRFRYCAIGYLFTALGFTLHDKPHTVSTLMKITVVCDLSVWTVERVS